MTITEVDKCREDLLRIEGDLESVGRTICSAPGSCESWNDINKSLEYLRESIRNLYRIDT